MSKTVDVQIQKHSKICVTMVSMSLICDFLQWDFMKNITENFAICLVLKSTKRILLKWLNLDCKQSKCQMFQIKKLKVISVSVSPCLN